jgi:hypothetical protein
MFSQVLAIAADNASANDVMIDKLSNALPIFPGEEHRVRCFNHVINLVAKSLLKLFDVPKKSSSATVDAAEEALQGLAGDLDVEELQTQLGEFLAQGDIDADDEDDVEDTLSRMTDAERSAFRLAVAPIRSALVKVSVIELQYLQPHRSSRFENSHSRLFIQLPSSCPSGNGSVKRTTAFKTYYLEMSQPDGIQRMTC